MKTNRFTLMHEAGSTKTTKEFNAFTTDVIFENFTEFLRGCGFTIDGKVDICYDMNMESDLDTGDGVISWTADQMMMNTESPIIDTHNPNIITGQ